MPRTKIDFHQTGEDAAAALSSLREVGLNPGDVGGAWLAGTSINSSQNDAAASSRIITVTDLGEVCFSGWLAEVALEAMGDKEEAPLSAVFDDLTSDGAERSRLQETLAAGGGIVGVRAHDTFSPEPD